MHPTPTVPCQATGFSPSPAHAVAASPAWRMVRVINMQARTVQVAERIDAPGTCAACDRRFHAHTDEQLDACAAVYAPTEGSAE